MKIDLSPKGRKLTCIETIKHFPVLVCTYIFFSLFSKPKRFCIIRLYLPQKKSSIFNSSFCVTHSPTKPQSGGFLGSQPHDDDAAVVQERVSLERGGASAGWSPEGRRGRGRWQHGGERRRRRGGDGRRGRSAGPGAFMPPAPLGSSSRRRPRWGRASAWRAARAR